MMSGSAAHNARILELLGVLKPRGPLGDVRAFHVRMRRPTMAGSRAHRLAVQEARQRLVAEEGEELCEAVFDYAAQRRKRHEHPDDTRLRYAAAVLGEACDVIYAALGAVVECDCTAAEFEAVWRAVHEANMQKLPGAAPTSKAIKPPGWHRPDLVSVLSLVRRG